MKSFYRAELKYLRRNDERWKIILIHRIVIPVLLIMVCLTASVLWGAEKKPSIPSIKDRCPVCSMFVYRYPDFLAQIVFKDGSFAFFDGPKDMYKYYFNLQKYNPKQKQAHIDFIYVTDYYSLSPINGMEATYVSGSDVYGPMGVELIPFGKESEAKEFMKDHKGKNLLRFQDITHSLVQGLN